MRGAELLLRWWERPDFMVRELFEATPDAWQDVVLRSFPVTPRIAMKASKGPGKTTTLAWVAWNFLLTRPHSNISAVSISSANLRDNLWKEMAVWLKKSPLLQSQFEWTGERIFHREHPETWWMSARSWSQKADKEQLGATLAGLHAEYAMAIMDESGAMPKEIALSAEGVFASGKEAHVLQAGNTNALDGALYDACVTRRSLWKVVPITGDPDDPLRSSRVDIEWAREMIANDPMGRESPFIKVLLLGEWPKQSVTALIGPDEIEAAMKPRWNASDIEHSPRILGVDVARQGDDSSVIFPRQGLVAFEPKILRNATGRQGAGHVARTWTDWNVDAVFIDASGGFGWPWIEALQDLNRNPTPVEFGGGATDKRYANKRTEIIYSLVDWIRRGGQLPYSAEMITELSQTNYTHKGEALIIEEKKIIKAKIGWSPDRTDALALTFSEPVVARPTTPSPAPRQRADNYDAIEEFRRMNR